jgi:hypothetical protein
MNVPKPSFAGAAGGGWRREVIVPMSGPDSPHWIVLICRCPAGAFLAANLPCTCRRWRLYFVQLQSHTPVQSEPKTPTQNLSVYAGADESQPLRQMTTSIVPVSTAFVPTKITNWQQHGGGTIFRNHSGQMRLQFCRASTIWSSRLQDVTLRLPGKETHREHR